MDTRLDIPPAPAEPLPALFELPQVDSDPVERADAARNRARILCAAERLFAEHGADCVSMDQVAEAAGVGKGTLFRRFGSRAALALTLLSEHERAFQEGFIRGEPPLGPGASPRERLIAFGQARLELIAAHSDVLAAAEAVPARLSSGPYAIYRLHLTLLVREADPDCDEVMLVETLLACLTTEFFVHMRDTRGLSLERHKHSWAQLLERLLPA